MNHHHFLLDKDRTIKMLSRWGLCGPPHVIQTSTLVFHLKTMVYLTMPLMISCHHLLEATWNMTLFLTSVQRPLCTTPIVYTLDNDDNDYSISGESINMPTIITSPEIQDKTDDGVDDEDSGNQSAPQRSSPCDHTYSYLFGSSRNTTQDMEHVHGVCSYTHILHFLFITSYTNHAIQMSISVFIIQMDFIILCILNRFGTLKSTVHIIFL